MRVETQEVRPDVVITLSHEEAQEIKHLVGLGRVDFQNRGLDVAIVTGDLRHALYEALKRKGV